MKVAHFAIFAPHGCGQYETVRDLILAERNAGIDAQMVDCGTDQDLTIREGLEDGHVKTVSLDWALTADVVMRHTVVPSQVYGKVPVVFAFHGRPENSFRLEQYNISPVITTVMSSGKGNKYAGAVTFWPEYKEIWSSIFGKEVHYIPAPIDSTRYTIEGEKHTFTRPGKVNVVICDMWREDYTPFNLIFAFRHFQKKYCPDAKLHLYGVPIKESWAQFIAPLQREGVIGEVGGVIKNLHKVYRSADLLITPNIIATRIIRESMASGLPCVAPPGCRFTPFTAEPRDVESFAKQMANCINFRPQPQKLRERILQECGMEKTGSALVRFFEKIVGSPYNAMSITKRDAEVLTEFIKTFGRATAAEFGSGVSTKVMGDAQVAVTSYETDIDNIEKTKKKAPTANYVLWDGEKIPDLKGDFVFIDGPHGGANREPAYIAAFKSGIPYVVCHDSHRPEDQQWIDKYFKNWDTVGKTDHMLILKRPSC